MMTSHIEFWHIALAVALVGCFWHLMRRIVGRSPDLSWRPRHLRHAQLVYAETLFRCRLPIALTAKVDRVYLADGLLHLVELKTRLRHCVYRYDVIELSAQRVAIQGGTGEVVATIAYVLTKVPGEERVKRHRVKLMSEIEVAALSDRRLAVLAGRVQPCRPPSSALCRKCAYAEPCSRLPRPELGR